MKILQICKKFPYPTRDGESIAITNLAKALSQHGVEVYLLAMNTSKHYFDFEKHGIPEQLQFYKGIQTVDIDNRVRIIPAFLNLFSKKSYHIQRFWSSNFESVLKSYLQEHDFDVIQLETPYLSLYLDLIRRYSKAKIAMRAHNVEFEIWERITANTSKGPKRWYLQYLTRKLKSFELKQLQFYDFIIAITKRDLQRFRDLGYKQKAQVIPIGFDFEDYQADASSFQKPLSIGFIGSLDWMPNLEGLQWFLEEAWPEIRKAYPQLSLHIAGRNTPASMFELNINQVQVHGEVASAIDFINAHSLILVPLLSGSGMRVKILEAMGLGKVVLTTSVGLEGIEAVPQKEVLIADSSQAFLEQISYCYKNESRLSEIGEEASKMVKEHFDRKALAHSLILAYQELLEKKE